MSATDTSQPSSDFLKSSRLPGDFELNSWTQGLGGAPRPNPVPASPISTQAPNMSSQNPHSLSTSLNTGGNMSALNTTATNRYAQTQANMRYDQKVSTSSQSASSNPFLSSPSLGYGAENRADPRGNLREAWNQAQSSDLQSFDLSTYVQSQTRPSASPPTQSRDYTPPKTDQLASGSAFSAGGFNDWGRQSGTTQENVPHQSVFDQLSVADNGSASGELEDYDADGSGGAYEYRFANKKILISTVLIGALIFGGGVSYLYNSFFGGASEGPTPLVKNAQGPSKVKPSDPGGKQFAHSDSKILGRLNDTTTSSETDASAETRKVSTLVVGRDGTIQPSSAPEAETTTPSVSVPVPGMTLIDGAPTNGKSVSSTAENVSGPGASAAKPENISSEGAKPSEIKMSDNAITKETTQQQISASSKVSKMDAGAQVAAVTTTAATPPSNAQGSASTTSTKTSELSQLTQEGTRSPLSPSEGNAKSTLTEADLATPTSQKKLASGVSQPVSADLSSPKSKPEVKTAALEPSSKTPRAPSVQPNGMGYVAVLASVPVSGNSRIVALQQFADLQQKYNGILQNKTPDVQEANLGEKGRYHRLIIGPPGSKETANSICAQLKSAGYSSCWIMVY